MRSSTPLGRTPGPFWPLRPSRIRALRSACALAAAFGGRSLAAQRSPDVPIAPRPGVGTLRAPNRADTIAYTVATPDPASHLYQIGLTVRGALPDTLRLVLPVWSPGRYARVDFARNLQDFAATDANRRALHWSKLGGSTWGVLTEGAGVGREQTVHIRYRIFANDLSGTYSVLDTAHANWNGAGLFVYVEGHKPDPVTLTIRPPTGWRVINGPQGNPGRELATMDSAVAFRFPNYDELIDAPTEVVPAAHVSIDSFVVDGRRYRVMLHHNGPLDPAVRQRFVNGARAIVARENRVIAPPPLAQYTFLAHAGYGGGDGMEHLTSTEIITPRPLVDSATALRFLGTVAHEYFHTWNVKRIRPAALGPFDYTEAQHEPSLWVAEGWTQYYGELTPVRVGLVSRADWYAALGRRLQLVSTSPARLERSPRAASFDAPFFDGARPPMQVDAGETFLTYYYSGMARALALDLMIRGESGGRRSLDDVLRALKRRAWDAPAGSYYLQGRGYTEEDVERAASEVAGRDLHGWFERYAGGTEDPRWPELLRTVGLTVAEKDDGWSVTEDPGATAEQVQRREEWLRVRGARWGSLRPSRRYRCARGGQDGSAAAGEATGRAGRTTRGRVVPFGRYAQQRRRYCVAGTASQVSCRRSRLAVVRTSRCAPIEHTLQRPARSVALPAPALPSRPYLPRTMLSPPSTPTACPVIHSPPGESRNAITPATSSGSPSRPSACIASDACSPAGDPVIRAVSGVRTSPGATQFTRSLRPA